MVIQRVSPAASKKCQTNTAARPPNARRLAGSLAKKLCRYYNIGIQFFNNKNVSRETIYKQFRFVWFFACPRHCIIVSIGETAGRSAQIARLLLML